MTERKLRWHLRWNRLCKKPRKKAKEFKALEKALDTVNRLEIGWSYPGPDDYEECHMLEVDADEIDSFALAHRTEQVNYFLYAAQNRFFVIKLDRPCHENSLWVVGPGAWADTPKGFLGMVRKNGSPQPAITAGEWITLEANKLKGTMEIVVKGTSIKGAALGDNRYMFPALQPAVYVLTGDALFDDIPIHAGIDCRLNRGQIPGAVGTDSVDGGEGSGRSDQ